MSSDLRTKKLGDVVALVVDNRGRNPKSYAENGIPVIDNYLITGDGTVKLSEVKRFIDDETYESFLREYIQEDDVLMTLVGNGYGKVAITPKEMCAIIQNTIGLRCNKNNDNQYLYYLLLDNREALMNLNRGAAQPSIKVGDVLDLEFQFPSLKEQRRVAGILRSIDSVIELNRQTNQTLEQMAQAIFKSWFVDFDPVKAKIAALEAGGSADDALLAAIQAIASSALFAIDAADADAATQLARLQAEHPEQYATLRATAELFPSAMLESELGEIPEGWSTKSIYEIADVIYGAPFKSKLFNTDGNGLPLVRIRDLKNERPGVSTPELHPKGYLIQNGDLLVGMDGEFRPYIWGGNEAWMNQRVCTFKPKDKLSAALIKEFITRQLRFFELTTVATTVIHLGKGDIDSFTYLNPNSELLHICSKILEPLFQKVVSNKVEIISLEEIRDALLPKLLSGELSVNQDVD